jgi:osmoprotectant transport system substrate-binding protein
MRSHRRLVLLAALLALALVAGACGGDDGDGAETTPPETTEPGTTEPTIERGTVVIGVSGAFAESQLVAEMYAQVLETAGYTVERQLDLGSREVSDAALFSGDIDLKPEYLAFELPFLDEAADTTGTAEEVYPRVQAAAETRDLVALPPSPANSTNVFAVLPATAEEFGLVTMSDLAPVAGDMVLGAPPDCDSNYACRQGLQEVYGIEFAEIRSLDFGGPQTVAALSSGAVDVGELFSLSSTITDNGFVVLEDDMELQPAGNFFPLIRAEVLNDEIEELLNAVTAALTTDGMLELVSRVELDQEDVATVATDFLTQEGLL